MRLLFCFFISFLVQSNPNISFKKPLNFNADVNINSEGNSISNGAMSFRNGTFIYHLTSPYNQTIAVVNGKLYVQDDDFQQVMISLFFCKIYSIMNLNQKTFHAQILVLN